MGRNPYKNPKIRVYLNTAYYWKLRNVQGSWKHFSALSKFTPSKKSLFIFLGLTQVKYTRSATIHNIFSKNHKWLVIIDFIWTYNWNYFFLLTNNSL